MTGKSNLAEGANLNPNSVFEQSEVSDSIQSGATRELSTVLDSLALSLHHCPGFLLFWTSSLALPPSLLAAET